MNKDGKLIKDRNGEVNYNNYGSKMTIIEYKNNHNIIVKFDNGCKMKTTYNLFNKGNIKSPYDKTVFGVGYIGEGEYKTSIGNNHTATYDYWKGMLMRVIHKNI